MLWMYSSRVGKCSQLSLVMWSITVCDSDSHPASCVSAQLQATSCAQDKFRPGELDAADGATASKQETESHVILYRPTGPFTQGHK